MMAHVDEKVLRVADEVQILAEAIGDPGDPSLLLIGGATWSKDWWEDELCHRLADRGRLVVRYDQRDTGRSTSYPPGAPGYTSADLVSDAVAVLDGFDIDHAHVAGLSMGGGLAQRLAIEHGGRVSTLTLFSTSPIGPWIEDLPAPTKEIQATLSDESPDPDWTDREAVIDYIVEGERPYAGPGNFDEARLRNLAGRVFDRSNDIAASMTNHFVVVDGAPATGGLDQLGELPALVLHGTADPLFPPAHGEALADAIPNATFMPLEAVGHQLPPPHTWDAVIDALIVHTS